MPWKKIYSSKSQTRNTIVVLHSVVNDQVTDQDLTILNLKTKKLKMGLCSPKRTRIHPKSLNDLKL